MYTKFKIWNYEYGNNIVSKNYRKNSLYTSMDNKLNIINGKIIQQYLINRNMSETEFDEFITGDGFFEGIGDLDINYNYDQCFVCNKIIKY